MAIGKIRKKYLKNIGINYIGLAYKPLKSGFKKALHDLNLGPEKVFMMVMIIFLIFMVAIEIN